MRGREDSVGILSVLGVLFAQKRVYGRDGEERDGDSRDVGGFGVPARAPRTNILTGGGVKRRPLMPSWRPSLGG